METVRSVNDDDFIFKVDTSCCIIEYILKLIEFPFYSLVKFKENHFVGGAPLNA